MPILDTVQFQSTDYDIQDKYAVHTSDKGVANGVAELDSNGKVPTAQLPAFVSDIIEGYYFEDNFYKDAEHTILILGESGKIYVDIVTNLTYRYAGDTAAIKYVLISSSLALGETSETAYRGDRGKAAYDHSQLVSGNPHNVSCEEIGAQTELGINPETTTATLTGLTIGDTSYAIEGGVTSVTANNGLTGNSTTGDIVIGMTNPMFYDNIASSIPVPINADTLQSHPANYFQSALTVNPASPTTPLTSIGINGTNYSLGSVADVKVNGTSVVQNRIANISMMTYEEV